MRGERGFALIAALWLLVALLVIGLEFGLRARERRLAAINLVEDARARAAADAGIEDTRAHLAQLLRDADPSSSRADLDRQLDPWGQGRLDDAAPDTVTLGMARCAVTLRDAGAALNANLAGEDDFRRLLIALRLDAGDADRLAQALMDWRDPDDLHRARGAEREDYLRDGLPALPRNAAFERLSELRDVRGMTAESWALVAPYLTLEGSGLINLNTAPRAVLLTLPGIGEQAAAALLRLRAGRHPVRDLTAFALELPPGAREQLQVQIPALTARTTLTVREVEVNSDGWTDGGVLHSRMTALLVHAGGTVFLVSRHPA